MTATVVSAPPKSVHHSVSWWVGQIALFALLWASLLRLPTPPSTDLDPSWQMAMGYAAHHDLQHGRDIVFTYGPLGYYFRSSSYMGELFGPYLTWQILSNLVIAAVFYAFGRTLSLRRQALYYAYLFCFGTGFADAMHMNLIAILALVLLRRREAQRPGWLAAAAGIMAVLSLVKFTNLMLCVFVVGALAVYYLLQRQRTAAAVLLGGFVAVFLAGWFGCGGSL